MIKKELWPEDIVKLLFHEEGQVIFNHIQDSAKQCMIDLADAVKNEEVTEGKREEVTHSVGQELEEAGEIRFSLVTVDNRIRREKQSNPLLKRYIQDQVRSGRESNNDILFDLLEDEPDPLLGEDLLLVAQTLRPEVNQSLRFRIQMTWCWDEILCESRKLSITRLIYLGHILTEAALILQDSETTKQVRDLLASLEIKITREPAHYSLPTQTSDLRAFLLNGVRKAERIHQHILRLDQQREALCDAQHGLSQQIETPSSTKSAAASSAAHSQNNPSSDEARSKRSSQDSNMKKFHHE